MGNRLTGTEASAPAGARAITDPGPVGRLCIECGLCCSGALFDLASHVPAEDELVRSLGLVVRPASDDQPAKWHLPCPQLNGTRCGAYGQARPSVCGAFFCELAFALDSGSETPDGALAKVRSAQKLVDEILDLAAEGETIVQVRRRWSDAHRQWQSDPAMARLHLLITALHLHLDRHFRRESQLVMAPIEQ